MRIARRQGKQQTASPVASSSAAIAAAAISAEDVSPQRPDIPSYVCPAPVSGGATPYCKWVADEPAPRAVRLAAGDLDRIHGHWLGR
jgi:hypothetical protein